jgi:hypothetical protein
LCSDYNGQSNRGYGRTPGGFAILPPRLKPASSLLQRSRQRRSFIRTRRGTRQREPTTTEIRQYDLCSIGGSTPLPHAGPDRTRGGPQVGSSRDWDAPRIGTRARVGLTLPHTVCANALGVRSRSAGQLQRSASRRPSCVMTCPGSVSRYGSHWVEVQIVRLNHHLLEARGFVSRLTPDCLVESESISDMPRPPRTSPEAQAESEENLRAIKVCPTSERFVPLPQTAPYLGRKGAGTELLRPIPRR